MRTFSDTRTDRRLLSLVSKRKLKYAEHAIANEKENLMKIALQGKWKANEREDDQQFH